VRHAFCIAFTTRDDEALQDVASASPDHAFASSLLSNYEGIRRAKQEQLWTQLAQNSKELLLG
jgi:hypothetical protein